ncbi:MAG TPA: TIGR01777 family oxidoreductase [Verrucomicrobiae bacterium]|nr:TIGR01777 family oxidoreductase [Verrucomicrobiae bacterium]
MNSKRIILAGGSGFLGTALARRFRARGNEVAVLTRSPRNRPDGAKEIFWDAKTSGNWMKILDGADAVINLTGRSVNCRYNARNRREILDSRVDSTRILGEAISRSGNPPRVWLNASTATIYKHSLDKPMDETSGVIGAAREAKDEFSVEVACAWEKAFNEAQVPATRKVTLRMTMVLGEAKNSVFPVMRRLVKCGLGGKMGSGRQLVSWIHEEDFCRAIEWILDHDDFSGVVNLAAPNPVTNREMMKIFRRVFGAPFGLPATSWMLEIGAFLLRTETELMIKSRNVVPKRLLDGGFEFRFPKMEDAVREIESRAK